MSLTKDILTASHDLRKQVDAFQFQPPTHTVYNPLDYAWDCWERYVQTYGNSSKKVVFLGMNPGPWGMAQVGVPFGEINAVKNWMNIEGDVQKPQQEHPKRPIEGFDCQRSEVSGKRLWGLFAERFNTADHFFADHFVLNYCPLVFMEDSGRNRTPDKLPVNEQNPLYEACDEHLRRIVKILSPEWVIGVGKFASARAEKAFGKSSPYKIDWILHPSPASPAANRDWAGYAQKKLLEIGVWN